MEGLEILAETIKNRREHPREGSYTNYLLDHGLEKVCKKLGEECTELVIATLVQDQTEQIGEACDLLYHLMVLFEARGITLEQIDEELLKRHGKQLNFKGERRKVEEY